MENRQLITQSELKTLLHYCPETGLFTWLVSAGGARISSTAGTLCNDGYVQIQIAGIQYRAHRLAFLYMEGEFPPVIVDHMNRITDDNRWDNLRHSTHAENQQNRKNNAKCLGVSWDKSNNKWQAKAPMINGRVKHIGIFSEYKKAVMARKNWEIINCWEPSF